MPKVRKVTSAKGAAWQSEAANPDQRRRPSETSPRAPDDLSARALARIFGWGRDLGEFHRWVDSGALEARNRGSETTPRWQVSRAALLRFLADERFWMAWSVEQITDPALRAASVRIRDGKPGWITVDRAAALFDVPEARIMAWIRRHGLPATRYQNTWWVRENAHEGW